MTAVLVSRATSRKYTSSPSNQSVVCVTEMSGTYDTLAARGAYITEYPCTQNTDSKNKRNINYRPLAQFFSVEKRFFSVMHNYWPTVRCAIVHNKSPRSWKIDIGHFCLKVGPMCVMLAQSLTIVGGWPCLSHTNCVCDYSVYVPSNLFCSLPFVKFGKANWDE